MINFLISICCLTSLYIASNIYALSSPEKLRDKNTKISPLNNKNMILYTPKKDNSRTGRTIQKQELKLRDMDSYYDIYNPNSPWHIMLFDNTNTSNN